MLWSPHRRPHLLDRTTGEACIVRRLCAHRSHPSGRQPALPLRPARRSLGRTIRRGPSNGAGMYRRFVSPRIGATVRKICSAVSIGSAISTTTPSRANWRSLGRSGPSLQSSGRRNPVQWISRACRLDSQETDEPSPGGGVFLPFSHRRPGFLLRLNFNRRVAPELL